MSDAEQERPWLFGFAATGTKSLTAEDPVRVGPLAQMNFLVGRNNHGKSTLMQQAVRWCTPNLRTPLGDAGSHVETLGVVGEGAGWTSGSSDSALITKAQRMWASDPVTLHDGRAGRWLPSDLVRYDQLWMHGRDKLHFPPHPRAVWVPAFRQIAPQSSDTQSSSGRSSESSEPVTEDGVGLLERLREWEAPFDPGTARYVEDQAKFARVQNFIRDVLDDPDATLQIANQGERYQAQIRLVQRGDILDLQDVGDGVKQVVMIAAACTAYQRHFILIEEPELHLHAGLQRKLMRYLAEETNNQYLIATHSAHILDTPRGHIFHVTHDGTGTNVTGPVKREQVADVCLDLGYMPSDLLQTNYTIWVEGPSDRLYWRAWLQLVEPILVEGIHFSIMSYGGRLVDDLTLADPEIAKEMIDDLVQVLRISRRSTLIADSDKKSEAADLPEVVQRLLSEAQGASTGHVIVCDWARTIECLVPRAKFRTACLALHPRAARNLRSATTHGPFNDPFIGMKSFSKTRVASRVVENLELPDLDTRLLQVVEDLARRIADANGISPAAAAPTD